MEHIAKQFLNPPRDYSPTPIWWWSGDELHLERLRWQMDKFVDGGVYNLVIMNLAPTGPLYGSDPDRPQFQTEAWWAIFDGVCDYASQIGIRLWFYDQIGFSGANLQGEIVRSNSNFSGQAIESFLVEGVGATEAICPSGGYPIAAFAIPLDMDGIVSGDPICVNVHERKASASFPFTYKLRLIYAVRRNFDYFSPEACDRLLSMVHKEIETRLSKWLGTVIVGSFQDELPNMPTWSDSFAESFHASKGYNLVEKLAFLWEGDHAEAQRVRKDYQEVRASLAEDAFFRPFFEWHERHGIICGFDQQGPARAGNPQATVTSYADYLRTHRWYGAPGCDHHGEAKIHSSLAHLNSRERVWIEAFHSSGWGGTLEETFDWLLPWIRTGGNLFNPHAVYYSTRGGWYEWAPPSTCWRQPYWRHYSLFANTVSRLCFALTRGHHVCDIGILFPTATIQANLVLNGSLAPAIEAQSSYLSLVGSMFWAHPHPGVLDLDRRDYDVLTDEAIAEAVVGIGSIQIRNERYRTILLPSCSVILVQTAEKLVRFILNGGLLIVIGTRPQTIGEADDNGWISQLNELFDAGAAKLVASAQDVPAALEGLPREIDAPIPTLHRRIDDYDLLFVPAAFLSATTMEEGTTWNQPKYSFSPDSYHQTTKIVINSPVQNMELWDPLSGERRDLPTTLSSEGSTEVWVPFERGPAALLVWRPVQSNEGQSSLPINAAPPQLSNPQAEMIRFRQEWNCVLVPTLNNRFGDLDKPNYEGAPPVATWYFEHSSKDGEWNQVQATFGMYAQWLGPCPGQNLPDPSTYPLLGSAMNELEWKPLLYSLTRGIEHDPLHIRTLGPKGHVPSEFLEFGEVAVGESVQVRTGIWSVTEQTLYMAIGACSAKQLWLNNQAIVMEGSGYHGVSSIQLHPGFNALEFRLTAEVAQPMRAYWALAKEPQPFERPEWMIVPEPWKKDDLVLFTGSLTIPFDPQYGTVQVAADAACRVMVNGETIGRQGGFDPYHTRMRVVMPYNTLCFKQGDNKIEIEMQDTGKSAGILVDVIVQGATGQIIEFNSGSHWGVQRSAKKEESVRLWRDWKINDIGSVKEPSFYHLWRRPHPLPGAEWLEDQPNNGVIVQLDIDATFGKQSYEWFRWTLPPGAVTAFIPLYGLASLWVDDLEVPVSNGRAALPNPKGLRRIARMKVMPNRGKTGGAVLNGPVTYEMKTGSIELGEWADQGLASYSGGIRYETTIELGTIPKGSVFLDLGEVRGTAEVQVNGLEVGTRIWSPYRMDVTDQLKMGINELHITVFNTLAPYLHSVSPTPYILPHQRKSGLFGPVRLSHMEFTSVTVCLTLTMIVVFP